MAPSRRSGRLSVAAQHVLHHITLVVHTSGSVCALDLRHLLRDLSFVDAHSRAVAKRATLELAVHLSAQPLPMPTGRRNLFQRDGLCGMVADDGLYVTEGTSLLHVRARYGRGTARLAPGFFAQPNILRQRFWAFGLLALLRCRGLYGLHAAGLVHPEGAGVLLVGPSGSGKSTLAIGLLREGWGYLSDDAVLLRGRPDGIEALALRKPFSVDTGPSAEFTISPLRPDSPRAPGTQKRRVDMQAVYPDRYCPACRPATVVFPRIVRDTCSTLRPLPGATALGRLLAQSGPELFDRHSAPRHMALLRALLRQAAHYELSAGGDLHERPAMLADLLAYAGEGRRGADHRRAHESL